MSKIVIKREHFTNVHYTACHCCGFNTLLLPEHERTVTEQASCCRQCFEEGISKKQVTPQDSDWMLYYGDMAFMEHCRLQDICERTCKGQRLPHVEIAHLYGNRFEGSAMYLDLYYDRENDDIYFRMCKSDEDGDGWYRTESHLYLQPEHIAPLLNKNGIHILDGMTPENWKEYFEFEP